MNIDKNYIDAVFLENIKNVDSNINLDNIRFKKYNKEMNIYKYFKFLIYSNYLENKKDKLDSLDISIIESISTKLYKDSLGLDNKDINNHKFNYLVGDFLVDNLGYDKVLKYVFTDSSIFSKKLKRTKYMGDSLYNFLVKRLDECGNYECNLKDLSEEFIDCCEAIMISSDDLTFNKRKNKNEKQKQK